MDVGLIGGIVGTLGGVVGGVAGTYFGIKNTHSPKERAFVVRAAVLLWIGVIAFVLLMLWLPSPYKYLLWIPYAILLPYSVFSLNRRISQIRQDE